MKEWILSSAIKWMEGITLSEISQTPGLFQKLKNIQKNTACGLSWWEQGMIQSKQSVDGLGEEGKRAGIKKKKKVVH